MSAPAAHAPTGPVAWLIGACARHPALTVLLVAVLGAWGVWSVRQVPLDAIPDLSDVQVIVFTEWSGRSAQLVEDQITFPISSQLLSAPGVRAVRGQSFFGISFVYAIFDDTTDLYWARSRVLEYMAGVESRLPDGVVPVIGPDATGVGWVFEYALVDRSGRLDLAGLRSLQDWTLRYALASVPGVAEVASLGGAVRQYQVAVDPNRLAARGIALGEVIRAVQASNEDAGGRVVEMAGHEYVVRGRGYLRSPEDLERVALRADDGVPITVGDVGRVTLGPDMRRGVAELDGDGEVVGGIVVMRYGGDALAVIDAVKARLAELEATLPEGVEIVPTYDRSELIRAAVQTLRRALVEELLIVSFVVFLFLLHVRSALVPILTIPLGVAIAFVPIYYQGMTANIMSLGGIAVAIGAMVDASIILVENAHKRLEDWQQLPAASRPPRRDVVLHAMQEVGPSLFFALLVITVSFGPIFALTDTAGRLFKPLAFTKTYAMGFAATLSVTLTPALAALAIRGRIRREDENPISRVMVRLYEPAVRWVVRRRALVILGALLMIVGTVPAFCSLGTEFMPPLNEGTILYMPTAPPGMSITEAQRVLQLQDRELRAFPEVARVFGKIGRAETSTDPAPLSMAETVITLKPRSEWRPGMTYERLVQEMDAKLRYPGMPNTWWMPIQTRNEMLSTGVRAQLGVKVFGADLAVLERASIDIEKALANVPGTRSATAERLTGGFYLDIETDRDEIARVGLTIRDVHEAVEAAIGGRNVTWTVEGRERYPVQVRYARDYREEPDALDRVLVVTPGGGSVPLGQLARLATTTGPDMVRSEAGQLTGLVQVDVGDRPIVDYVAEAKAAVAEQVELPPGVRIEWAGQFRSWERARDRLFAVLPLTVLLVVLLLYSNTGSTIEVALVLLAVPFSLIGAVWMLWLLDYHLSIAVWVGIIALAGLDAETGVVMLLYLRLAHRDHEATGRMRSMVDLEEAIVEGAARRLRPKAMTVIATMAGLLPLLWSSGVGADVMKRIAAPMVGGLTTSFALELLVYPALFAVWKRRSLPGPEQ
ncbi:CusA/CzcA family heavy metal efflux RND transporter [Myxococcota bacterium]|nr:CusA/CzcA family heavy metal efflux RND transporter [Myxococcota bacterium]MCZ7619604.1 CusA/CzcA family heavy metal efflux RND transporter [Myxococcota bacterium]